MYSNDYNGYDILNLLFFPIYFLTPIICPVIDLTFCFQLTALKAQIDNDAACLQRYQTEKSELMGSIGELQAKIRNLEGQVSTFF